jgi:predicted DNA-binding transcriptional regulator AlpA
MQTHARATSGKKYVRTRAAAARLSAAEQTLERWRTQGLGPPFIRLSPKLVVYDVEDLDAWCSARKVLSTSEPRGGAA